MAEFFSDPRELLESLFEAAVAAVGADRCLGRHLPPPPRGRLRVVGAGKAAAAMARTVEENWSGPLSGLVVTRYGHAVSCRRIAVIEASHPIPDRASRDAATRVCALVSECGPDDLVLALFSGGGSALLALPASGLTLADKQAVNQALLNSGAPIDEINCVRKHLSAIKGGRLALACAPASVVTLVISDVPGDDPGLVASGPTVADPTTCAEALAVLEKHGIDAPAAVWKHLRRAGGETPKPGDPRLASASTVVVASARDALAGAAKAARAAGLTPVVIGEAMRGEARDLAREHARNVRRARRAGQAAPIVLLSGGEATVTLGGGGRGGPNAEFLLALALALEDSAGVFAIACDTDGIDGSEDNAGALVTPDTLSRAAALGVNADTRLADNDSHGFFAVLGDLVVTGPTRTNVSDFRAILVLPPH